VLASTCVSRSHLVISRRRDGSWQRIVRGETSHGAKCQAGSRRVDYGKPGPAREREAYGMNNGHEAATAALGVDMPLARADDKSVRVA
jgi:hypothetical protein